MKRSSDLVNGISKKTKFGQENELGIIESVCLKNFMCHDHLKFEFDPHINFIIGQNGSGKSAILTGIILALGGKSSFTGRYSNIRGFVKTGKQKASISVVLKNCGNFAYKPDAYGKKCIIEREISIEGVSSYKLKSEAGRIISVQKEELNNILNAMDIQVENPVLVLTQETSRSFLMAKTGKEEKLYEFFYRGTGLYELEQKYRQSAFLKDEAKNELKAKQDAIPNMEKEVNRYKRLVNSSKKVTDLKNELQWANIREMEKRIEDENKTLKKIERELLTHKTEAERCKVQYNKICLDMEQYKKEKGDCDTKMATLRQTLSDLASKKDTAADNYRKSQGTLDLYNRQEKKLSDDIYLIEKSIRETEILNQSNFEEKRRIDAEKMQKLEADNIHFTKSQENSEKKINQLYEENNKKQQTIDQFKAEINNLEYKKNSLRQELNQLSNALKNRQNLFGDNTVYVHTEIKKRSREFIQMPIGPIGLYLEVKDPKWSNAIETCVKRAVLCSFCCDNSRDSSILKDILYKYYGRTNFMPSIIVSKFLSHVHDISAHRAQSQFPTVYDMLRIKNNVVANCLIDQLSIENRILIEDIPTAQEVMLNDPPRNCYSAYLQNCDEILLNPYRHYAALRQMRQSTLQSIDSSHIESVKQELNRTEESIQYQKAGINEIFPAIQLNSNEIQKIKTEIVKYTSLKNQNNRLINELKQYEEPRDISGMQEDLEALRKEMEEKLMQKRETEQRNVECNKEFQTSSKALEKQKNLLSCEKMKFDDLGKKVTACGQKKEVLASSKKQFESHMKTSETELRNFEAELQRNVAATQQAIEKASEVCDRIATDRSIDEINLQINETKKVIEESSKCKREELLQKFKEKLLKLQDAKKESVRIGNDIACVEKMLKTREKKLNQIIKQTKLCLDLAFIVVLKYNQFTGRLDFSKPGALRLEATPKQANTSSGGGKKQCSSLSGGERSFVTIAFLLALWDRIKMPFRILDEYDVFMDSNNRDLSINLLIKRANFMRDVQFIFLSPLELPEMRDTDNIKVHKMPAPKRMGLTMLDDEMV